MLLPNFVVVSAFLLVFLCHQCRSFQLSTTSKIRGVSPADLHDFLATPTNWPKIVASSFSVKEPKNTPNPNRIDVPLKVGDQVEEVFGLPPLLPLSVTWECVEASAPDTPAIGGGAGRLEFYSASGVPNIAKDCRMKFDIQQENDRVCSVKLDMEFEPVSPLILGAAPILKLDNDLALRVLLPSAIKMTM